MDVTRANKFVLEIGINTTHDDIILEPEILKPRLVPLLQMSNKEFKQTYGHLVGAWRGKNQFNVMQS